MLPAIEALELEDREIFWQVLTTALEQMTHMQRICLLMSIIGFDQSSTGRILGVGQDVVSRHFTKALAKVKGISVEYL